MFRAAITSAWPFWPHAVEEKVAWLGLFLSPITPALGAPLAGVFGVDRDAGSIGSDRPFAPSPGRHAVEGKEPARKSNGGARLP
jgi:hypothetical protein